MKIKTMLGHKELIKFHEHIGIYIGKEVTLTTRINKQGMVVDYSQIKYSNPINLYPDNLELPDEDQV